MNPSEQLSPTLTPTPTPNPTPSSNFPLKRKRSALTKFRKAVSEVSDPVDLFDLLPKLLSPRFSDAILVHLCEDSRLRLRCAGGEARTAPDPIDESVELRPGSAKTLGFGPLAAFLRRAPMIARRIAPSSVDRSFDSLARLSAKGTYSAVCLPLGVRGKHLGTITLLRDSRKPYTPSFLPLASELAYETGLALDNALTVRDAKIASRAREEALGVISHDLKSPLTAISLQSHLIANAVKGTPNCADVERYLSSTARSIVKMEKLIGCLADFGRLRDGKLPLKRSVHSVAEILDEAKAAIQFQAASKGISFESDIVPEDLLADCDADRIQQVLENLVGNAVKFSPPNARISLGASRMGT